MDNKDILHSRPFSVPLSIQRKCGITRISDITGLDIIGVPVFSAFRGDADMAFTDGNTSVYNGKGLTKRQAKLGAIMEGIERFSAERKNSPLPCLLASERDLKKSKLRFLSPARTPSQKPEPYRETQDIEWIESKNLIDKKTFWVPAYQIFCPYVPIEGDDRTYHSDSNGLASAASHDAAIACAVLESVERDALNHWREKGGKAKCQVDLENPKPEPLRFLLKKIRRAGINLLLKDITTSLEIPAFMAALDDPQTRNPYLLAKGTAAHWDPFVAMTKAILEAIQGRGTYIQGARESLYRIYDRLENKTYEQVINGVYKEVFTPESARSRFRDYRSQKLQTPARALAHILGQLKRRKFTQALYVNLTSPLAKIPTARVVIPGLGLTKQGNPRSK